MNKINNDFNNNIDKYKKIESKTINSKNIDVIVEDIKIDSNLSDEFISSLDSEIVSFLTNINKNIELFENIIISSNLTLDQQMKLEDSLKYILSELQSLSESIYNSEVSKNEIIQNLEELIEHINNDLNQKLPTNLEGSDRGNYLSILNDLEEALKTTQSLDDTNIDNPLNANQKFNEDLTELVDDVIKEKTILDENLIGNAVEADELTDESKKVIEKWQIDSIIQNISEKNIEVEVKEAFLKTPIESLLLNDDISNDIKDILSKLDSLENKVEKLMEDVGNINKKDLTNLKNVIENYLYIKDIKNGEVKNIDLNKLLNIINLINNQDEVKKLRAKEEKFIQLNPNIASSIVQSLQYNNINIFGRKVKMKNIIYISIFFVLIFILFIIIN